MTGDDPGLLGNLPRSRPGTRSAKRPSEPAGKPPKQSSASRPTEPDDPVGDALRTAARTAEAGLRVANEVTRQVLRRLPRP